MTARAETVTILVTDLVSSTELLQRADDHPHRGRTDSNADV